MVTSAQLDSPIGVWLKVDTGMHRLGIQPAHVREYFGELRKCRSTRNDVVIATHLSCADDIGSEFTIQQLATFRAAVAGLEALLSVANSAGLLGWKQSHGDWNRPGYMLYGNSPFDSVNEVARHAGTIGYELLAGMPRRTPREYHHLHGD